MCEICANAILLNPALQVIYNDLKADASEMRDRIWKGDMNPSQLHLKSVRKFHDRMFKEMKDELDWGDFGTLKPDSIRYKRLASLELNSFVFSSLKNYEFLNTVKGIRNKKGMTRTEFDREFEAAHNMVYNLHSDVEIKHARSVATSIRNWENVERYGDTMPYLTYQTAGDERVRESHAAIDNITKLWNDPFWDVYYPPNGYGCRCYVTQDFEGDVTDLPEEKMSKLPAPDKSFDINWGKQNRVWQKTHTYLNKDFGQHPEVNDRISQLIQSNLKAFYKVDENIYAHPLIGGELDANIATAKLLGNKMIRLNPDVKLFRFKNVDSWINGKPAEFKVQGGNDLAKFLTNRLRISSNQRASYIVLNIKAFDSEVILRKLRSFFIGNENVNVRILSEGKDMLVNAKNFETVIKPKSS